jgi:hypothetical protein
VTELDSLIRAIAAGEAVAITPALAIARVAGADYFLEAITHHVYAGDSALHIAAVAYRRDVAEALLAAGAHVRARNRRGAEPLHYACDGGPGPRWNPRAQGAMVTYLIAAGADPNAVDKSGVAPLHRAVRTRCTGAVRALLAGGADVQLRNGSGSTARQIASQTTGRGGSGSPEAKAEQAKILGLLDRV